RTRILFFLYSDIDEHYIETDDHFRRRDFWPFYTWRKERNGDSRLQVMALLEPFFPNNRAILRSGSQLWSFWRDEHNEKSHVDSQSLLWNLYRHESSPKTKKISLFFGL